VFCSRIGRFACPPAPSQDVEISTPRLVDAAKFDVTDLECPVEFVERHDHWIGAFLSPDGSKTAG
jgi:hypothetical protein